MNTQNDNYTFRYIVSDGSTSETHEESMDYHPDEREACRTAHYWAVRSLDPDADGRICDTSVKVEVLAPEYLAGQVESAVARAMSYPCRDRAWAEEDVASRVSSFVSSLDLDDSEAEALEDAIRDRIWRADDADDQGSHMWLPIPTNAPVYDAADGHISHWCPQCDYVALDTVAGPSCIRPATAEEEFGVVEALGREVWHSLAAHEKA